MVEPATEDAIWKPTLCDLICDRRAVIVDDERDARCLLNELLSRCEADEIVTATAENAIGAIERDRPGLLISDVGMPIADAYQPIRRVRAPARRLRWPHADDRAPDGSRKGIARRVFSGS